MTIKKDNKKLPTCVEQTSSLRRTFISNLPSLSIMAFLINQSSFVLIKTKSSYQWRYICMSRGAVVITRANTWRNWFWVLGERERWPLYSTYKRLDPRQREQRATVLPLVRPHKKLPHILHHLEAPAHHVRNLPYSLLLFCFVSYMYSLCLCDMFIRKEFKLLNNFAYKSH